MSPIIKVIIPAFNEADSIGHVINEIPSSVNEIIVVNNNSSDNTVLNAEKYKNGKKIKEWFSFGSFKKENKLSDLK